MLFTTENKVYMINKGCTLDYDDTETKDSIALGMDSLKTALDDYNMAIQARQTQAQQPTYGSHVTSLIRRLPGPPTPVYLGLKSYFPTPS
jgi:hypothetical protein